MKAAFIERTGPPKVIQYGDLPDPRAEGTQVLVKVAAVAVNPIDAYLRAGTIPMPIPTPYVIGCDLCGVVEALGPDATRFKVGDWVWGSNQGLMGRQGTFAELAAVDECWLYPLQEQTKPIEAAAIALVGITAHLGLFREAGLTAGQTVYVSGGTGGVGSMVVQMAKAVGARVITTAGNKKKAERCEQLGADQAILYKRQSVAKAVRDFAPEGVDVWFETLREPNFELAVPLLAKGGRMVVMAGRDAKPPLPVGPFYTRDCKLSGFAMFNASPEEQSRCAQDINWWLGEGKLKANIDCVMKLSEAAKAHKLQEESTIGLKGKLAGKIVLTP